MKAKYILLFLLLITMETQAQDLSKHLWKNRIILVFGLNVADDEVLKQKEIFQKDTLGIEERDLIIYWIYENHATLPSDKHLRPGQIRRKFWNKYNDNKEPFLVILIGKDGTEKLRQTETLSIEKLFSTIDAMPMRKREMKE